MGGGSLRSPPPAGTSGRGLYQSLRGMCWATSAVVGAFGIIWQGHLEVGLCSLDPRHAAHAETRGGLDWELPRRHQKRYRIRRCDEAGRKTC